MHWVVGFIQIHFYGTPGFPFFPVIVSKDTEFLSQKGIVIFLPSTKADWVG